MQAAIERDYRMIDDVNQPWVDISIPVRDGMPHWPSDPAISITRVKSMERGDSANLSMLSMGAHSGTHVDAPVHFIKDGTGVDEIPLDTLVGRARVVEITDTESVKPGELAGYGLRQGERVLFKTRNSPQIWRQDEFAQDFVFISDAAADFLAASGIRLVGVDYLSVGSFKHGGSYVHKTLLGNGICIIEGLNLSNIKPGNYDLICLPLRLTGGDGAPARAIIRPATLG